MAGADIDSLFADARAAFESGDVDVAIRAVERLVDAAPDHFQALLMLAQLYEVKGRHDEAVALYERALEIEPRHAFPWTRRAMNLLRREWGMPPPAQPARPDRPGISIRSLGSAGRFGNQVLQYGVARLAAERHGLEFEAPDWIGRDLFGFDDPLPTLPPRPPVENPEAAAIAALTGPVIAEASKKIVPDGDLAGFFQGPTGRWAQHRDRFRELFAFTGKAAEVTDLAWNRLANQGYLIVAIHLRRGDFGTERFWIAPTEWYASWLEQIWPQLPGAALYVASDDPDAVRGLEDFDPVTAAEIADEYVPGAEFLIDYAMLAHADIVGISNSSFSFTASMLNPGLKMSVRPDRKIGGLVPYDPWNAPVLLP
jgi:hypothetical protein